MKTILLCIGCFCTFGVFAQTTKKTVEDPASGIKEKYFVLKANNEIKEGKFERYGISNSALICEGYYKNNLKDSLWTFYLYRKVIETGYYKDGKKTGVWDGLDYNGEPNIKYDFTANKLLFFKVEPKDTGKFNVIRSKDTVSLNLERPPVYLEGDGRIFEIFSRVIRYPAAAREDNIQGKVLVAFIVDENGMTSNFRIKKGIGHGCDEEAMKAVKSIEGDWLPGMLNGKPVTVEYVMPISFTLAND